MAHPGVLDRLLAGHPEGRAIPLGHERIIRVIACHMTSIVLRAAARNMAQTTSRLPHLNIPLKGIFHDHEGVMGLGRITVTSPSPVSTRWHLRVAKSPPKGAIRGKRVSPPRRVQRPPTYTGDRIALIRASGSVRSGRTVVAPAVRSSAVLARPLAIATERAAASFAAATSRGESAMYAVACPAKDAWYFSSARWRTDSKSAPFG